MSGFKSLISTTADSISSGGTITGDLTIEENLTVSGDLTVSGGGILDFDEILEGTQVIDVTNVEAFLVRKNSDGGDVFTVDTTNSEITAGVDGAGIDVIFYSGTAGDNFTWDSSAEKLTITGTNGQTALDVADGNLVVADNIDLEGDIDVNGTANLDVVDIDGAVNMAADLTMGANILMADDTSIGIADDAERIEFDASGDISVLGANFGIGVSDPSDLLEVYKSGADSSIAITAASAGNDAMLRLRTGDANDWAIYADGSATGDPLVFYDYGSTDYTMTLNQGNVGIGTQLPSGTFHTTSTGGHNLFDRHSADAVGANLYLRKSRNATITSHTTVSADDALGTIWFSGSDGDSWEEGAKIVGSADETFSGSARGSRLTFHTTDNTTTTIDERLRIDHNGKIGIGVSDPDQPIELKFDAGNRTTGLNLNNSNSSGYGPAIYFTTNGDVQSAKIYSEPNDSNNSEIQWHNRSGGTLATRMTLKQSNLGIGTTTPDTLVEAESSSSEGIQMKTTGSNTVSYLAAKNDAVGWQFRTDGGSSDSLMMYLDGTGSKMTIMTGGNVGIGIDSPSDHYSDELVIACADEGGVTLVASATSHKQYINFADGTSGDARFMGGINYDHNTNVLALRCNGGDPFLLDGNSKISLSNNDSDNTGNTIFGKSCWNNSSNNASDYNTIFGEGIMGTGAVAGATYNTVVGAGAAIDITSGDNNNLFGAGSGANLTTGSKNIAIGNNALSASTDVDECVIIGDNAGLAVLTGSGGADGSVGIGASALAAVTSASGSTAVGYGAAKLITTGSNNTVMGYGAFDAAADTESNNVAIGYDAMGACDQGSHADADIDNNVCIGYNAGLGGDFGSADKNMEANVAIGANAMDGTGTLDCNFNNFIGYGSGGGSWSTTGSNYNVGIGGNTLSGAMQGANNNTAVGHDALKALTTGTGNVVLGQAAADALTTGADNVAIGRIALGASVAGMTDNIAIGANAMGNANHASSDNNVAVGGSALATIGTNANAGNVAIGFEALTALTSGTENTAVGFQAGKAMTTGGNLTAVGYNAAPVLPAGANANTAIGGNALLLGDNGSTDHNTCVGYQAGDVITSGGTNTIIGSGSDPSGNTGENQTVVGYGATGQANDSVTLGNASVTAVYMAQDKGANVHCAGIDVITNNEQVVSSFINDGSGSTDASFITIQAAEASGQEIGLAFCVGTSAISSLSSYNIAADIRGIPTNSSGPLTGDLSFRTNAGDSADERMRILGSGLVGIGDSSPDAHLDVEDTTIDTTTSYNGIISNHIKTAGATDASDNFIGTTSTMTFNDGDAYFGDLSGLNVTAYAQSSSGGSSSLSGGKFVTEIAGSTDIDYLYGLLVFADITAGTVDANLYGQYTDVDIESGCTLTTIIGQHIQIDADSNPSGEVWITNVDMYSNVDYAYRQYDHASAGLSVKWTPAGEGYWDGVADNGNADYAEYFESNGEVIPIGNSVTLVDGKIKQAEEGDAILGVIRPHGAVALVGNSAWSKWQEKLLTDDYGAKIMEDYTVTKWFEEITFEEYSARGKDETGGVMGGNVKDSKVEGSKAKDAVLDDDGNELEPAVDAVPDTYFREHKYHSDRLPDGVTAPDDAEVIEIAKQRQKLNPDYDATKTYVPREERDEWHIVGLLGQIPVTKGQPTGTWIKMKDVSDTVEMYFVK